MRLFRWLAARPIAAGYDLRRLGWRLLDEREYSRGGPAYPVLVQPDGLREGQWRQVAGADLAARRWMLLLGIDDPGERARLLRLGFGDALGPPGALPEVEARALRLIERARALPRCRWVAGVRLDLLERDAFVADRAAGLHPREFALIWRLADSPGRAVAARELLADVWRLSFRPETNSLAVHVSRLRAKLRALGADGLIETLPDGAYRLTLGQAADAAGPVPSVVLARAAGEFGLDAHVRLGEEQGGDRMPGGGKAEAAAGSIAEEEDSDHGTSG